MAAYTLNVSPGTGSDATSDQQGRAAVFGNQDTLTVQINSAFVAPAKVSAINFFTSTANKSSNSYFRRVDASTGNSAISATITYPAGDPPPQGALTLFNLSVPSNRQSAVLTNASANLTSNQHVWFAVEITDGNRKVWTLDPEVINTGGSDPRRGFVNPTQQDSTQTLGTSSGTSGSGTANTPAEMPEIVTRNPTTAQPAQNS